MDRERLATLASLVHRWSSRFRARRSLHREDRPIRHAPYPRRYRRLRVKDNQSAGRCRLEPVGTLHCWESHVRRSPFGEVYVCGCRLSAGTRHWHCRILLKDLLRPGHQRARKDSQSKEFRGKSARMLWTAKVNIVESSATLGSTRCGNCRMGPHADARSPMTTIQRPPREEHQPGWTQILTLKPQLNTTTNTESRASFIL